jgi:hypothetical protein
MKIIVCSAIWGSAWERYAHVFAETFVKYWNESIELIILSDKDLPLDRGKQIDLYSLEDYKLFTENYVEHNLKHVKLIDHWRFDLKKWMPQVFTPKAILDNTNWNIGDILVWIDADVETRAPVDETWINEVIGDFDIACLQRRNSHTEIGFYAMKLNEKTVNIINKFASLYTSFEIKNYKEWHSAYTWDIAVASEKDVKIKNLNVFNISNHPFDKCILTEKLYHKKGNRKPGGGLAEYQK